MDLKYLEEVIIPQREKEIEEGKNACTAQPIYVVLNSVYGWAEGHTEIMFRGTYRGDDTYEEGYIDVDDAEGDNENGFTLDKDKYSNPRSITRFKTDVIVAFFFTRKGAEEYLRYQSHNLSDPYIYTFCSGYNNREMDAILKNK